MKFKFIGKEPMILHGFGVKSPDSITEVDDARSIGLLEKSPLFVKIDEPKKREQPKKVQEQEAPANKEED
jgi:tryptophan synthase alpha subunit